MKSGPMSVGRVRSRVVHIYDPANPLNGCYCCEPGDPSTVVAPKWAEYISDDHLCANCVAMTAASSLRPF